MSDYTAVAELVEHGVAGDLVEAAALALTAGVDMDMVSGAFVRCLPEALARGLAAEADIDAAVARVLRLKERLGLFDDPYRSATPAEGAQEAHRALALDAARRAITLLSNHGILPLAADLRRIAVIGPLADARGEMLGPWSAAGAAENCVTILEGLKAALPDCELVHCAGVSIESDDEGDIERACALARSADVVVLCLGESAGMSGEAACRATPGLPGKQRQLAERIIAVGAPTIALLSSGRPLTAPWLIEEAQAVLATWFLGDMAGHAIADVLTGRFNPCARLAATWPRDVGQVPIFYASRSTGRPPDANNFYSSKYLDCPVEPQFPFGHGLSYARVTLANLRVNRLEFQRGDEVEARVDARNESEVATEETIFLFLHDVTARVARPLMELKAWAKIALAAGDCKTVAFTLSAESFSFPDEDMKPSFEPGAFEILVGLSADRKDLLTASLRMVST
jgi:beta-glucosidase